VWLSPSVLLCSLIYCCCCCCSPVTVPRFPRTLTAGLQLELVIQDVVAEPCTLLLQDSSILQV
jgi:hypothetical protein